MLSWAFNHKIQKHPLHPPKNNSKYPNLVYYCLNNNAFKEIIRKYIQDKINLDYNPVLRIFYINPIYFYRF